MASNLSETINVPLDSEIEDDVYSQSESDEDSRSDTLVLVKFGCVLQAQALPLEGVFVCYESDLTLLYGLDLQLGDIAGASSAVHVELGVDNFEILSEEADTINMFRMLFSAQWSLVGTNPFIYLEEYSANPHNATYRKRGVSKVLHARLQAAYLRYLQNEYRYTPYDDEGASEDEEDEDADQEEEEYDAEEPKPSIAESTNVTPSPTQ